MSTWQKYAAKILVAIHPGKPPLGSNHQY